MKIKDMICKYCKAKLKTNIANKKFCSMACKDNYNQLKREIQKVI